MQDLEEWHRGGHPPGYPLRPQAHTFPGNQRPLTGPKVLHRYMRVGKARTTRVYSKVSRSVKLFVSGFYLTLSSASGFSCRISESICSRMGQIQAFRFVILRVYSEKSASRPIEEWPSALLSRQKSRRLLTFVMKMERDWRRRAVTWSSVAAVTAPEAASAAASGIGFSAAGG